MGFKPGTSHFLDGCVTAKPSNHWPFLQPCLQYHLISSCHDHSACSMVLHKGMHGCWSAEWPGFCCPRSVFSFCYPQSAGLGRYGTGTIHLPQTHPPWYLDNKTCCLSASCGGGMFSMVHPCLDNKHCLAEFTLLIWLVRSYRRTTKLQPLQAGVWQLVRSCRKGKNALVGSVWVDTPNLPCCCLSFPHKRHGVTFCEWMKHQLLGVQVDMQLHVQKCTWTVFLYQRPPRALLHSLHDSVKLQGWQCPYNNNNYYCIYKAQNFDEINSKRTVLLIITLERPHLKQSFAWRTSLVSASSSEHGTSGHESVSGGDDDADCGSVLRRIFLCVFMSAIIRASKLNSSLFSLTWRNPFQFPGTQA